MNILYLTPYKSFKSDPGVYDTIKEVTANLGHTLLSNVDLFEKAIKEPELYTYETIKLKKQADVLIADVNTDSTGIGYEIEWSLSNKKPTILLYNKPNKSNLSLVLSQKKDRLLYKLEYENENNLKDSLNKLIKDAKGLIDTKFILIIPAEMDRYLEWAGRKRRMHKAQIVRNAVERDMSVDKEWKAASAEQNWD